MKTVPIFLLLFTWATLCIGQKSTLDTFSTTSSTISRLSYFWKLDSLANNGFRLCSYESILKSKVDTVPISFLLEKLGAPNKIQESNRGVDYIYYYFDYRKMPEGFDAAYACFYISFFFEKNDDYLKSISRWSLEL